jgi:predicted Zn-dependent peptidase
MNILQSLERDEDRLEEMTKNYMTFGKLTFNDYLEQIDKITSLDINVIATQMLAGLPTIIVTGSDIESVPSVTEVQKMLNG